MFPPLSSRIFQRIRIMRIACLTGIEKIRRIAGSHDTTLVKIADDAHNGHPDRAARLPEEKRVRLAAKYRAARDVLWAAVDSEEVEHVVSLVNPSLLPELRARGAA